MKMSLAAAGSVAVATPRPWMSDLQLVHRNPAQEHPKLAVSREGELRTAINVEVHDIVAIRSREVDPRRQPLPDLLNAGARIAIRCENLPIGEIEGDSPVVR